MPGPGYIACGVDTVWLGDQHSPLIVRVQPAPQTPSAAALAVPVDVGAGTPSICVSSGAVWLTAYNAVARIDPVAVAVDAVITVPYLGRSGGYTVDRLASDDSDVWVAGVGQESIRRIDASTNAVAQNITIPARLLGLRWAGDALWMADRDGGAVVRVSPEEERITATIPVGGTPTTFMWHDGGLLWVEVAIDPERPEDRTLVRIDPRTNRVLGRTRPWAGPSPGLGDGHVAHGSLWRVVAPPARIDHGPEPAELHRIDAESSRVVRSIPLPVFGVAALTKDGGGLWLAGYDVESRRTVIVHVDAASDRVDRVIAVKGLETPPGPLESRTARRDRSGRPSSAYVFACSSCGDEVSRPVRLLDPPPPVPPANDGDRIDNWIPPGRYTYSSGPSGGQRVVKPVLNAVDLINTRPHHDRGRRTDGCCGTTGMFGPNVMCSNGHEVGIEADDCWSVNGVWLLPEAVGRRAAELV